MAVLSPSLCTKRPQAIFPKWKRRGPVTGENDELGPSGRTPNLGQAAGTAAMGCPRLVPAEPTTLHRVPKSRSSGLLKDEELLGREIAYRLQQTQKAPEPQL